MSTTLIYILISYLILLSIFAPVFIFFHELGHAIVGFITTNGKIEIIVGRNKESKTALNIEVNRIRLSIQPFTFIYGICLVENWQLMSRDSKILLLLCGPIVTLLLFLLFVLLLIYSKVVFFKYLISECAFYLLTQFIFTIIPIKYPALFGHYSGMYSDGYKILKIVKSSP